MGSLKHELQKRIEATMEYRKESLEVGHKKIQERDDWVSSSMAPIEAIDDDDFAIADVAEADKKTDLDSIVSDKMPLYVSDLVLTIV